MFSTLLGPLPPDPDRAPAVDEDAALGHARLEAVTALAATGLELVTDGSAARADEAAGGIVERWRAAAGSTATPVKQVLLGPWSAAGGHAGTELQAGAEQDPEAVADRLRPTILALAAAGCSFVEIWEPSAPVIATDPDAARRFAAAHRRLVDGSEGVHCSLAVTGGNVDGAGPATFFDLAYASYAFDLIAGPENWRLIVEAPADRGIVCGALGLAAHADETREVLVWAAHYAASTRGRGLVRVGLANAPAAPGSPPPTRADLLRKLAIVAEASRIAAVESAEELAGMLDPRAIDPRSAALGRFAPARRRRS